MENKSVNFYRKSGYFHWFPLYITRTRFSIDLFGAFASDFFNEDNSYIMSPVKISAIKTHVPTISRISASTVNVNNYIGRRSLRSVSRNGSDGTDDDEQIIAVPGWDDDSDEEVAENTQQSDNESTNSSREPTQFDSDSETEEQPPAPKRKQVRAV